MPQKKNQTEYKEYDMSENTKVKKYLRTQTVDTAFIKMAEVYAYRSGRRGINVALSRDLAKAKERRAKLKVIVKEPESKN